MSKSVFKDSAGVDREIDSLHLGQMSTWQVARRLALDYLRPQMRVILIGLASMLVVAATTGAVPFLIQQAADEVFAKHNEGLLYLLPAAIVAVVTIKGVAEYIAHVSESFVGNRVVADLRIQMFDRLAHSDLSWLQRHHSGRFISSFLTDSALIREAAGKVLVALGQNLLKVAALMIAMFWMDWRLAILAIILMPLGVFLLGRQRRKVHHSATKSLQETGDLGSLISQTLTGIRVVKAYHREAQETARAAATINRAVEFVMRSVRAKAAAGPTTEALTGIGFALAVFYAGFQGIHGNLTIGHFMGFATAAMLTYQPIKALATLQTTLQEGVAASVRIFGIIDQDRTVTERPGAGALVAKRGDIEFDRVNFSYNDGQEVLSDFSLKVPAGSTVALVGPSGAGKSTVLNLLLRFFDPESGRILIDGTEISGVTLKSLRMSTALLTQEPFLFDDTIGANIAYGADDATPADIEAAARLAAAHDFIMRLPKGYDTPVGEAGNSLSGGERQRIAFARAMLKNAPILLLDEPTSSLDSETEAQVQRALEKLLNGRTVVMIAHRLSTVKNADMICVMNRGRIVETGRHDELIAKGGLYSELHRTQLDGTGLFAGAEQEAAEKPAPSAKTAVGSAAQ
ncbi:MAG: ABC transporter ATP-binding protein [Rhodobiaceae bacterium]|nr:ABC transporter ATP-binding protein [Rhodobiaceae bacterium]